MNMSYGDPEFGGALPNDNSGRYNSNIYVFNPVPIFEIQTETLRAPNGSGFGYNHTVTLEGTLLGTGMGEIESGIEFVGTAVNKLYEGFNRDGLLFLIRNTGIYGTGTTPEYSGIIISGYPTIEDIAIRHVGDQYTRRADYTITMSMPSLLGYTEGRGWHMKGQNGTEPPSGGFPPFIESVNETWDVAIEDFPAYKFPTTSGAPNPSGFSFADDSTNQGIQPYFIGVTHTVEATARLVYTGTRKEDEGGENERTYGVHNNIYKDCYDYLTGQYLSQSLSTDNIKTHVLTTGLLGAPYNYSGWETYDAVFNHFKSVTEDRTNRKVTVVETFLVGNDAGASEITGLLNSPPGRAYEEGTINLNKEGQLPTDWSASVQGVIQGFNEITYDYSQSGKGRAEFGRGSLENARNFLYNYFYAEAFRRAANALYTATGQLESQSQTCASEVSLPPILDPVPASLTLGENAKEGTINYDITYKLQENGIKITTTGTSCILSQTINVDISNPVQVFASQSILGRAAGPLLQDLGTKTAGTVTVTVETVSPPPTSLSSASEAYKFFPQGEAETFAQNYVNNVSFADGAYNQSFKTRDEESYGITEGRYTRILQYTYGSCSG